jgi:hypothetical protein
MHPQLQQIAEEFQSATARLERLASEVPAERWSQRPDPERWSVGECVAHLNLTGVAFVPVLRAALEESRGKGEAAPRRYRRDPLGWLLWLIMPPPVRLRTRTPAGFIPEGKAPPSELVTEFLRLQEEQLDCVREADGLPLHRVKIPSPFDARARYNLFSALSILPRHQHRHLWQAEQVAQALWKGGTASV